MKVLRGTRRRPRWLQRLIAETLGYFWMPCPLCRREFGGHEWSYGDTLEQADGTSWAVCVDCGPEARRLSEPYVYFIEGPA